MRINRVKKPLSCDIDCSNSIVQDGRCDKISLLLPRLQQSQSSNSGYYAQTHHCRRARTSSQSASPIKMKAPLIITRAALVVPKQHYRAGSTLPSLFVRNAPTPRRLRRTYHYTSQNIQRYCTAVRNNADRHNCVETKRTAAGTAGANDLNPFKWSDIVDLFTDPNDHDDKTNNYIPSDHPNLALFRRSTTVQDLYEEHKNYLANNWKSPYDYLVYSKFGEEFGFEKELIHPQSNGLSSSPEGFRYQCNPSLSQASDYTIQNGLTYLKLVLNDFL